MSRDIFSKFEPLNRPKIILFSLSYLIDENFTRHTGMEGGGGGPGGAGGAGAMSPIVTWRRKGAQDWPIKCYVLFE